MLPRGCGGIPGLSIASARIQPFKTTSSIVATRRSLSTTVPRLETPSTRVNPSSDQPGSPLPEIKPATLSHDALLRLHKLSALNPPAEGSEEERELVDGLGELIGLMELVKDVELEGDVGELLAEGVGEVVIDGSETTISPKPTTPGSSEKSGKELLDWATRRVGDFYAHRVERKL